MWCIQASNLLTSTSNSTIAEKIIVLIASLAQYDHWNWRTCWSRFVSIDVCKYTSYINEVCYVNYLLFHEAICWLGTSLVAELEFRVASDQAVPASRLKDRCTASRLRKAVKTTARRGALQCGWDTRTTDTQLPLLPGPPAQPQSLFDPIDVAYIDITSIDCFRRLRSK